MRDFKLGDVITVLADHDPGPDWIECSGRDLRVSEHPGLYDVIGTNFNPRKWVPRRRTWRDRLRRRHPQYLVPVEPVPNEPGQWFRTPDMTPKVPITIDGHPTTKFVMYAKETGPSALPPDTPNG